MQPAECFKDLAGRVWNLHLTVGALDRMADAGFDLSAMFEKAESAVDLLHINRRSLVKGLWALCEEQAAKAGVTPQAFVDAFDGPTINAATDALMGAIVVFHHRSALVPAVTDGLTTAVKNYEQAVLRLVTTSAEPAGNSPDSSGSIPAS